MHALEELLATVNSHFSNLKTVTSLQQQRQCAEQGSRSWKMCSSPFFLCTGTAFWRALLSPVPDTWDFDVEHQVPGGLCLHAA